jgi:hypothetical protein
MRSKSEAQLRNPKNIQKTLAPHVCVPCFRKSYLDVPPLLGRVTGSRREFQPPKSGAFHGAPLRQSTDGPGSKIEGFRQPARSSLAPETRISRMTSGFLPRILGVALMVNCFAFLISSLTSLVLLLPHYEALVHGWMRPFHFGEQAFMLWLLIMGAKPRPLASPAHCAAPA